MRILIVDDSVENIVLLERLLKKIDSFELMSFSDPEKGLAWAFENAFDLLIVDYKMPGITGVEFIRKIRSLEADLFLPILMISASDDKELRARALEAGANDFLDRPIDREELGARVKNMMRLRQQQIDLDCYKDQTGFVEGSPSQTNRLLDQERYALAAQASKDGLWDWNLGEDKFYFSPRWCEMIGYRSSELLGLPSTWFNRVHPDDLEDLYRVLQAYIDGYSDSFQWDYRLRHRSGFYHWMQVRATAIRGKDDRAIRLVGSQSDINERKTIEEQLSYTAFHDTLTGLPNRSLLNERLSQAFSRYKRDASSLFAVLFIDLDKFKEINDSLGHSAGDILLQTIAGRIEQSVREADTAARLAGDEFIVLLSDIEDTESVMVFAKRLLDALQQPFLLEGKELAPSISMGVALVDGSQKNHGEILKEADSALYKAKTKGRGCIVLFNESMKQSSPDLFTTLDEDMREALQKGEMIVYYQPILRLKDKEIVGFEALVRWHHPRFGLVMPDDFIPSANERAVIIEMGRFVRQQAFFQLAQWQKKAKKSFFMTVNVARKELYEADFLESMQVLAALSGVNPKDIVIEIAESSLLSSFEAAGKFLKKLQEAGYQIALDDFASLQSNFNTLIEVPFNLLKIDRSLVMSIEENGKTRKIIDLLKVIAKELKAQLIFEGIENQKTLDLLKRDGSEWAQGFFFARPQPPEEIEKLIDSIEKKASV